MSFILVTVLLAAGITIAQWLSAAEAVTLRWLRLGDLISLSLLALGIVSLASGAVEDLDSAPLQIAVLPVGLFIASACHLILVQSAKRAAARALAALTTAAFAAGTFTLLSNSNPGVLTPLLTGGLAPYSVADRALLTIALLIAAWLLGGSLITMLLGHAYLTAGGEMTFRPFLRLTRALAAGLLLRAALAAAFALPPWLEVVNAAETPQTWNSLLVTVRFLVGIAVPLVLVLMAASCVKIRSYQSATGILYVAGILILIGELTALSLIEDTTLPF